ncbi:GntR family transcriptional regulator [Acuticoccus mangrovi]|uniref:GntR family transcriptional regulator n=1 Tax=Acuticoccus mangrovi TaxID=2796142 RepID=A0A934IH29_9HYPH|nr:GntR family transcriptional regulator [Acuticoccus mangrovi]MBJ3776569.1 GntR family transcriptional regulator [Acuticoccus mangrovi]
MTTGKARAGGVGDKVRHQLSNQILDIVRDRRMDPGDRLAEIALASEFGVSRTPVRAALLLLAEKGVVEARPNHGFSLRKGWAELKTTRLAVPATQEDDLYMRLIRERVEGLIPASVTQSALLERYGVNRAVLIKTLSRMADEGVVSKNRGHGWTFMPALDSGDALRDSYNFRLTLEPAALRLADFRVDLLALDRMRRRHLWLLEQGENMQVQGWELFELDANFHETLVGFSGNAFFTQAIQQQNRLRRPLEYQGYRDTARTVAWMKEHMAVMDALYSQDMDEAEALLRRHLSKALDAGLHEVASRTPQPTAGDPWSASPPPSAARG